MLRKFASIMWPNKFGYAVDTEQWESRAQVHSHYRQFETYGDGLCQHSHNWPITIEFIDDFLGSLAVAMVADEELCQHQAHNFQRRPSIGQIEFAASVVYKEGKRRYWTLDDKGKNVVTSADKRYDKRYQEVESWCDGSPEAIYRILIPEYADALQRYATADAIRDWVLPRPNGWMPMTGEFLKWKPYCDVPEAARRLRRAFNACRCITESYRLREEAKCDIASLQRDAEQVNQLTEELAS